MCRFTSARMFPSAHRLFVFVVTHTRIHTTRCHFVQARVRVLGCIGGFGCGHADRMRRQQATKGAPAKAAAKAARKKVAMKRMAMTTITTKKEATQEAGTSMVVKKRPAAKQKGNPEEDAPTIVWQCKIDDETEYQGEAWCSFEVSDPGEFVTACGACIQEGEAWVKSQSSTS